jgi:hypothetical protein
VATFVAGRAGQGRVGQGCHGGQSCDWIIAQRGDGFPRRATGALHGPFVVLLQNRACLQLEIRDCEQHSSNSPGYGCAISRNRRWLPQLILLICGEFQYSLSFNSSEYLCLLFFISECYKST